MENFLDYEHSKMLEELALKIDTTTTESEQHNIWCFHKGAKKYLLVTVFYLDTNQNAIQFDTNDSCDAPTYWQAKQFLWEKHKISLQVESYVEGMEGHKFRIWNTKDWLYKFDSPITAEMEGIKSAIQEIWKQKQQ